MPSTDLYGSSRGSTHGASDSQTNSPPASWDDRRRHRRAPLDVLANRFLEGYPYLCRTTDISSEGLRLQRLQEPTAKTPRFVGLQFQLPGSSEILTASGEVVFNDERSRAIGLRFTHLSPATAAAISGFVHGVPAKERPPVWPDSVES